MRGVLPTFPSFLLIFLTINSPKRRQHVSFAPCECTERFTEILARWWQNDDDTFCKSHFKPRGSEPAAVRACLKAWCYSQCCRPCAVKCLILTLSLEQFLIWPAINFMEMTGAAATHHRAIGTVGPGSQTFRLWSPLFICIQFAGWICT